jgi:hypothetical protein
MDVKISYSLFADSIRKQLKKQKVSFELEKVKVIEQLAFNVLSLSFHEIITDSIREKSLKRIHERLLSEVWVDQKLF